MKAKKKRKITYSSAKAKGRIFQQDIAKRISMLLGIPWGYNEQIAPREMGQSGTDIRLIADAKDRFPWSVECKRVESVNLFAAVKQAKSNQVSGTDWVLFLKRSREDAVAVLDIDVFFDLLRLIPGYKKGR